jgi:hypothetical protein
MQRIFIIFSVLAAAIIVGLLGLYFSREVLFFVNPNAEVDAIKKHLAEIPNTRTTYVSDLSKQASQCITAYVELEGKGEIGFNGLSLSSFRNSSHIRLHGIGPYCFRTRQLVKGQEGYGYDIDVGPSSPIPAARKLEITSVQSAIMHYDDLLALVANWPVTTNEWPTGWPAKTGEWSKTSVDEIHFADLPRGDFFFCLKRSDFKVSK